MPKLDHCKTCVGYCWGNDFSRVSGENRVPLLFVGESSGATEARKGEPFVGAAGKVLEKALNTAGLKRADYNLSNLLRCFVSPKTSVFTPNGYMPMFKLNVGDEVLTHNGRFKKILCKLKFVNGPETVVKISLKTSGNYKTKPTHATVTLDHQFMLDSGEWVTAQEVKVGDKLKCLGEYCLVCNTAFFRGFRGAYSALAFCSNTCHNRYAADLGRAAMSVSMRKQYADGSRDPIAVTKAAHAKTRKLIELGIKPFANITDEQKYRRRVSAALTRQALGINNRYTWIGVGEDLTAAILDAAGVEHTPQYAIGPYNYDFRIGGLIVEVDGEGAIKNGLRKTVQPIKDKLAEDNGFKVIHVPANDVGNILLHIQNDEHDYPFLYIDVVGVERLQWKKGSYSLQVEEDESYVAQGFVNHNCKPPDNELRGTSYEYTALAHCRHYLNETVAERRPKIIVALGELPLRELAAVPATQSEHRGYLLPSIYPDTKVIGTFHPSRILRGDWKLFGIFMHDIRRAVSFARNGVPERRPTHYLHNPTDDQIRDYIERLRSDVTIPISYDTETPELIGEKSDGKTIMLMQFSSEVGTGMALEPSQIEAARIIMALTNPKWGWADRTFDRALLRANGFTLNGELHDLMNAHAHLQSGLMSTKDETSGEKNIPAKLMSLQSCTSLYFPWERPWKRMVKDFMEVNPEATREQLMAVVKQYGCIDVDMTLRNGLKLFEALRRGGLYGGYYEHKFRFSFVLDDLHETGLPVDRGRQEKVRAQIDSEDARLLRELQLLVPEELQALHPEFGYVSIPKWAQEKIDNGYDATCPPLIELSNSRGYLTQRMVTAEVVNKVEAKCVDCEGTGAVAGVRRMKKCSKCKGIGYRWQKDGRISRDELRWALVLFNPNSSQHILSYINYRICEQDEFLKSWGTELGRKKWHIPLHIDTKRPTTGQKELEGLIDDTDDEALKVVSKIKKLTKLGGTYCGGDWVPGDDGRVHGVFRFGTASGQTSCTQPNQQQWPSHFDPDDAWLLPIMEQIKSCIRAEPGHVFVKIDAKGAHSRQQAWLAEDADYYRLANLGSHAFVTAHYVGVPDKDALLPMDDESLRKRLNEIKKQYDWEYNFAKRVSFNMQYLGGAQKAAHTLRVPVIEVVALMEMIKDRVFPKSFKDYPEKVRQRLRQHPRLVSAQKSCRWIWDDDVQQAVAFCVANEFHCHWQSSLIRLREKGLTRRFPMTNFCHDDAWFHVREQDVDDCIAECRAELEKPSTVLVNSLGAFQVGTEVQVGYDMLNLRDV